MARRRISDEAGRAALAEVAAQPGEGHPVPGRDVTAMAVRYLLQLLAEESPGNTVEVRVPPYGAVQCVPGPRHTRGTPPNVVEMAAATWLALAAGSLTWADGITEGSIHASGQRADLTDHLPIVPPE